jgi:hypothetical protein
MIRKLKNGSVEHNQDLLVLDRASYGQVSAIPPVYLTAGAIYFPDSAKLPVLGLVLGRIRYSRRGFRALSRFVM